jgi:hypothetical protein
MRRLVTLLAAVCLLALPSAALAQNAGDEQYNDPFGGSQGDNDNSGGSDGTDNGGTQGPVPTTPAQTDGTLGESQPEITEGTSGATLPRTGLPLVLVAATGGLLLAGGTTLRRRAS